MSTRGAPDGDTIRADVCVVGGGPAGSTIARQLAVLGHDVCLVERSTGAHPRVGATLPPGILPLLSHVGVLDRVMEAGFPGAQATIVWWSTPRPVRSDQPEQAGLHVERGRFDSLLLDHAAASGVRVLAPVTALRPARLSAGGWRIPIRGSTASTSVVSRFLVDAGSGRGASAGARPRLSPPLLALYARWRGPGADAWEGRVEAGEREWFWYAPIDAERSVVAVFMDPGRLAAIRGSGVGEMYTRLLGAFRLLPGSRCGHMDGPVSACDASTRRAVNPVGPDFLAVGDSALALDPLSSQGIQSAIASAIQGAVILNTLIRHPERRELAMQFYRDRLEEKARQHARRAAVLYGEAAAVRDASFWRDRAADPEEATVLDGGAPQPEAHALGAGCRVRLSSRASIEPVPVIEGDVVVPALAVRHESLQRPVSFVDGVNIAALLRDLGTGAPAGIVVRAWSERVPAEQAWKLMRWLWSNGIVVEAAGAMP